MKIKSILVTLLVFACLFSCSKEQESLNDIRIERNNPDNSTSTKSNNVSDDFIISAIKGENKYYTGDYRIYRLEKLLAEQSPLSEDVLEELILMENKKVPDYLVELSVVLSKQKGNVLSLIATERPNINIQFIAKNIRKNKDEDLFIKINTIAS